MNFLRSIPLKFPKLTLTIGTLLLLIAGAYGIGIFSNLTSDESAFYASGSQSAAVDDILKNDFKSQSDQPVILFTNKSGSSLAVTDPRYKNEVDRMLAILKPDSTVSYYTTGQDSMISHDKRSTYVAVSLPGDDTAVAEKLVNFMNSTTSDFLEIHVGGRAVGQFQVLEQTRHDLAIAEAVSLPIVAILLFVFFRSVVAALMPLVIAGLTICGAFALAHFIQNFTSIDTYTINVITVLSLGLSVDYSLLAVNRFREELALKKPVAEAARITSRTAGRTIFFSALTVMICLLSLMIFPVGFMHAIAIGGVAAVFVAMSVSLVFMPALFRLLGPRIDKWSLPRRKSTKPRGSTWRAIAAFGTRRPWATLVAGLVLVTVFAIPLLEVKPVANDYRTLSSSSSAFFVGQQLDTNFDAPVASLTVLATYNTAPTPFDYCQTAERLAKLDSVKSITGPYAPTPQLSCGQLALAANFDQIPPQLDAYSAAFIHDDKARFNITPVDGPTDQSTIDLIAALRNRHDDGITYQVGGDAALTHDTLVSYAEFAPYILLVIIATMFLVLTFSLGSIVIPLQSIVINSLGLLIAVGSLVLLYQFGWLQPIMHQVILGGLNPAMPILVCVVAFGLSMDYAVFLYSRMHEIYDKTNDPHRAILDGVQKTGPIITAAALVFFAVVAAIALSHIAPMQQIGVGLAIAILVDAFVIRILFVPAVMQIFGRVSWYAPRWIKRLIIKHE